MPRKPRAPKPLPLPPLSVMTVEEVAEVFGYSTRAVRDWKRTPGGPFSENPPFDLPTVGRWLRQQQEDARPTKPGTLSDKARARRLGVMADLAELELAKRRGEMLPRGDCFATFYEFAGAVKTSAEAFAVTAPAAVAEFNRLLTGQQRDLALRYPEPVARKKEPEEASA